MTWFTSHELFDALQNCLKRGVRVRLVLLDDAINYMKYAPDFNQFVKQGGELHIATVEQRFMHHKFCVIDGSLVITGSYNWTYYAESRNIENVVITDIPQLAAAYGRALPDCRWEHGLHTAVEVKEGVIVQPEHAGMAVISLKNYFKLYDKICGMSGTVMQVEDELREVYGLRCAVVPTHKPVVRDDRPLRVFRSVEAKQRHCRRTRQRTTRCVCVSRG